MTSVHRFEYEDIQYFKFGYSTLKLPLIYTYVYFVDGLLIDTGQSRARKSIVKTLSNLDVKEVFITHHHEDHTGNIDPIQKHFKCNINASLLCCEIMKKPPKISLAQYIVWGSRPAYALLTPIQNTLKTAKYTFQLIPIPGHADDMVALYEPDKKWLFSADLYISSYIGYFLKDESILGQIQSLRKVLKLDFKEVFCSHNPQLKNGRSKLEEKLYLLEDFYSRVVGQYKKGYSAKEIFKILGCKEHGFIHLFSHGYLSKLNMVTSAVRDYQSSQE